MFILQNILHDSADIIQEMQRWFNIYSPVNVDMDRLIQKPYTNILKQSLR